jgi:hypothetical protein
MPVLPWAKCSIALSNIEDLMSLAVILACVWTVPILSVYEIIATAIPYVAVHLISNISRSDTIRNYERIFILSFKQDKAILQ